MTREEIRRTNARRLASTAESKAHFARLLGMEASQVSQLIGPNPTKNIGNSIARRIEKAHHLPEGYLDVPHPELDGGTVDQANRATPTARPFDENVRPAQMGTRPIPVISAVQAGQLRDMQNPYEPGDGYAIEYTDDMGLSRWTFALDIEGQSMMPDFRPGDRIIVDPEVAPNPGDFVIARNTVEQATFKKYRPRGIDHSGNMIFELVPLNDDYPTLRSDTEHLSIIGVLMEHRKKFRRH